MSADGSVPSESTNRSIAKVIPGPEPLKVELPETGPKRDVGSVCRKGLRTLAHNLLLAFAFSWLQGGVPKSQPFGTGSIPRAALTGASSYAPRRAKVAHLPTASDRRTSGFSRGWHRK